MSETAGLGLPEGDPSQVAQWLVSSSDELFDDGVDRVEVRVPASDRDGLRALHLARFRRDGRLRRAGDDGEDVFVYSRLSQDDISGTVGFTGMLDSVLPTHRVIAHVLFTDEQGRVLLLETTYKPDWELPGGVVDPGESPRVAAQRELAEELGTSFPLGQPLEVDWMPPYLGWGDAIEFIFDGGLLPTSAIDEFRLTDGEIAAAHWVEPGDLPARVTELSARRLSRLLRILHGENLPVHTETGRDY